MQSIRSPKPKSFDPGGFTKNPNDGLLTTYPEENEHLGETLLKRRQKLAEHKIGLSPDSEDTIS